MNVIYSIGVRFGGGGIGNIALHAVRGIHRHGCLKRLIVATDESGEFEQRLVRTVKLPRLVNKGLYLSNVSGIKRSLFVDSLFDRLALKHVQRCDIFHGWGNFSLKSLKKAKSLGATAIIDRASSHPKTQNRLLDEEFRRFLDKGYIDDNVRRVEDRALEELSECDHIVVPSDFAEQSMIENGISREKILKVPFGVDIDRFRPAADIESVFRVLFVGQVSIRKGVQYLLEAWRGINLPDSELLIVGMPEPNIEEVIAGYADSPNIRFVGHVPDPVDLFQSASVFVFPSIEEGSALVNYEAMACGLPVVTTLNSGTVARDGVDGFIVPIRDPGAIKEKILMLYEEKETRLEMGRSARERVQGFTWERYGDGLVETYGKITSRELN
jgi:glycosyltransferase involved in cell wall biosynthesis